MEQRSAGGMTSSNVKIGAKLSHGVLAVLKSLPSFSVSLSSFFPADIAFIRCRS